MDHDEWYVQHLSKLMVVLCVFGSQPTNHEHRGWLIPPFHEKNPTWVSVAAILPALLATILLFMDQQITAVIVNRKENKLKVGAQSLLDSHPLACSSCVVEC